MNCTIWSASMFGHTCINITTFIKMSISSPLKVSLCPFLILTSYLHPHPRQPLTSFLFLSELGNKCSFFVWLLVINVLFWDSSILLYIAIVHSFFCWIVFHCMNTAQLVYWFTCWWTLELSLVFTSYKWNYMNIHVQVIAWNIISFLLNKYLEMGWLDNMSNFLSNYQIIFQSGFIILHSTSQAWQSVPLILRQHLVWLVFN